MGNNIQIANLELQITSNSNTATQGIDNLIQKLEDLRKATSSSLGLNKLAKQFDNFNNSIKQLDISKLNEIKDTLTALRDLKRLNLVRVSTQDGETQTTSPEINNATNTSNLENTAEDTERIADAANDAAKNVKDVNKELENGGKKAKKFRDGLKGAKKGISDTSKSAKKSTSIIGKFVKSLGRIAFYRIIRTAIKKVGAAIGEGINNLYKFDKELGGDFSASLDSIAGSIQTIKNSIGLIAAPFIQALAPALEKASDLFMQFGNTVSKVSAQINGKTTYTKAVRSLKTYEETLESAKNSTQSFDELNIADQGGTDVSTMYEQANVNEDLSESESTLVSVFSIVKEIGGIIKNDIAPILRDIIKSVLPFIPPLLEIVGKVLREIVSKVGEILNSDSFKSLIETIADVIGSIIKMLDSALPTISNIIELIAGVITQIVEAIDHILKNGIGKAENSTRILLKLIDRIIGFVGKILELLQPILDIVVLVIDIATTLVDSVLTAIEPILDGIFDIIEPILDLVVNLVKDALQPIIPILGIILELIGNVLAPILERIGTKLKPYLEWIGGMLELFGGIIGGLADFLSNNLTNVFEGLRLVIKAFFSLFSGDIDNIKDAWGNLGKFIKDSWHNVWRGIGNIFINIINKLMQGMEKFVNAVIDVLNKLAKPIRDIAGIFGKDIGYIEHKTFTQLPQFAQGGYDIPSGQLFIANERGAEMVGTMNNRTTVANNEQIVEGIKQGVFDAMMSAVGSNNGEKQINLALYLDGRQIKAEIDKLSQSKGASISTGGLVYYG